MGAVVTGGASGIGFATASELGHRGVDIVLADVEADALNHAVERLRAEDIRAHAVPCDVTSLEQVESLASRAFDLLESVHIVFNNAGVAVSGPIAEMTHQDWRWVIDVDLWGPIHGVEAFLPRLIDQGQGGHVIFTSSFAGLVPNVGLGPYCVAKYGVVALAEVLHRELRHHRIGVSVLCPMRVATEIDRSERNRDPAYGEPRTQSRPAGDDGPNRDMAGRVIAVQGVAGLTIAAIEADRLYILPHDESRPSIQRRFARIDQAFDEQKI
jgi:NAD(P)-dependent dehydrogenase (short-subunit alcohol dehydrogenase family)